MQALFMVKVRSEGPAGYMAFAMRQDGALLLQGADNSLRFVPAEDCEVVWTWVPDAAELAWQRRFGPPPAMPEHPH